MNINCYFQKEENMRTLLKAVLTASLILCAATVFAYENIAPDTAYTLASTDANVYILDVRTAAEWQWVGHPGKNKLGEGAGLVGKVVNIPYEIENKGSLIVNPSFLSEINEIFGANTEAVLITMCRSGSRSAKASAALETAGYRVLNLAAGFEGGTDAAGYRTRNGWKVEGLPYTYSGAGYQD